MCRCLSTMALTRMGCCIPLLYGPTGASKNIVKDELTLILRM